jgi:hypothetical protein
MASVCARRCCADDRIAAAPCARSFARATLREVPLALHCAPGRISSTNDCGKNLTDRNDRLGADVLHCEPTVTADDDERWSCDGCVVASATEVEAVRGAESSAAMRRRNRTRPAGQRRPDASLRHAARRRARDVHRRCPSGSSDRTIVEIRAKQDRGSRERPPSRARRRAAQRAAKAAGI